MSSACGVGTPAEKGKKIITVATIRVGGWSTRAVEAQKRRQVESAKYADGQ